MESLVYVERAVEVHQAVTRVSARRIPELDGLRGLAILLVLVWHYIFCNLHSAPNSLMLVGGITWSGVDLFFVLSGFLIGGILLDARPSQRYFKTFYIRRFYRIVPIYAILCLIFWVALGFRVPGSDPGSAWLFAHPFPWFTYATFTQNVSMAGGNSYGPNWLGITWSLAVEEQFYLTLPLVIRYLKPSRLPYVLACVIVGAPILRIACSYYGHEFAGRVLMLCRADSLLMGVGAALLFRNQRIVSFLSRYQKAIGSLAIVMAVIAVRSNAKSPWNPLVYSWLAALYVLVLLMATTAGNKSLLGRCLRIPFLMATGTIAYALYLFHQAISGLCYALIRSSAPDLSRPSDVAITLLAAFLTFATATVSWRYIEKPLIARSHSYSY